MHPAPLPIELASRLARLALASIHREYPHKLDHVMASDADVRPPRDLHPAFHGCYDWHSAVHAHWVLARVLRASPGLPEREQIIQSLTRNLTPDNIAAEIAYLERPLSRAFERTYGWAWLLKLHEEIFLPGEPRLRGCSDALRPLARAIGDRYLDYLPRLTYPIRTGVHANTAFGLWFALDWANNTGYDDLGVLVADTALHLFEQDTDYPARLEPSGSDFLSPALIEAGLMSRVLRPAEFAGWFASFLPGAARGEPRSLFSPALVSDRSDPQIVHLDGLNLSRAWCVRALARAFNYPAAQPALREHNLTSLPATLLESAAAHEAASLPGITSGDYAGEHWLGTFALLATLGEH